MRSPSVLYRESKEWVHQNIAWMPQTKSIEDQMDWLMDQVDKMEESTQDKQHRLSIGKVEGLRRLRRLQADREEDNEADQP